MTTLYEFCKQNHKEYLLQEWDYELNTDFDIKTVTSGSNKRVWWKCSKCGHKWQTSVEKRAKNSKCPCCVNRVVVVGINDLATTHPEIAKEWHPSKNGELTPKNVTSGSNKRVWWKCLNCGYEWQTSVNHRISGNTGCANCHKHKNKDIEKGLGKTHPEIAKDWDYIKNGNYKPNQFRKGSNFIAWWKCHECGNEIQRAIHDYDGCPKCKTLKCIKNENLLVNNKYLMSEWDYEQNKDIDYTILSNGSNKRVWWKCSKCGHKWQTSVYHRAINGSGCPKCRYTKRKNNNDNLLITYPEIAKDWHPTKNYNLTPDMFTKGARYEVWWKCHICGKEIQKSIKNYNGCRDCKKQTRLNEKNLSITHPDLVLEWNYNKNKTIKPSDVFASNPKKVWWKCKKCDYEWQAKINNRALLGRGCPCCTNKIVVVGINDLATTHPEIAKEWHPTKNGNLKPSDVTYGSGKKVWWLCHNGHEYQATILHRTQKNGTNCPICNSGRQTSFAEQAVYYYVKKLYPDTINRFKADFLGQMELDIYIPSLRIAIEYDGIAWHKKEKIDREKLKYQLCKKQGIKLIRFREEFSELGSEIADQEFGGLKNLYEHDKLEQVIIDFLRRINYSSDWMRKSPIDVNIKRDKQEILQYKTILRNDNLQEKYPEIAEEWHPSRNGELKPNMFKPHSEHKAWWLCPICGYEYESTIAHRTDKKKPTGCPKCAIKKVNKSKKIAIKMIDIKTNKIIRIFSSITEAANFLHINGSNITSVCKGKRNYAGGYKWEYLDKD